MQEFARGLKLAVPDRDEFEQYILDNAHDPGATMDGWGHNSVPDAVFIAQYSPESNGESYYKAYDRHVNGEVSWNYWGEPLLKEMVEAGVLIDTGEYNVDFVEQQDD